MEIQNHQKSSAVQKPTNYLLLQQTMMDSRCFPAYSFQDAMQTMIKIYGQATALINSTNPQIKDTVSFSLKSMVTYYESMEGIMYMQKDNLMNSKSGDKQQKHKSQMQSYDKQFVLANLKSYCIKKSTQKSIELAKMIFKNGGDVEEVLQNMGYIH